MYFSVCLCIVHASFILQTNINIYFMFVFSYEFLNSLCDLLKQNTFFGICVWFTFLFSLYVYIYFYLLQGLLIWRNIQGNMTYSLQLKESKKRRLYIPSTESSVVLSGGNSMKNSSYIRSFFNPLGLLDRPMVDTHTLSLFLLFKSQTLYISLSLSAVSVFVFFVAR